MKNKKLFPYPVKQSFWDRDVKDKWFWLVFVLSLIGIIIILFT